MSSPASRRRILAGAVSCVVSLLFAGTALAQSAAAGVAAAAAVPAGFVKVQTGTVTVERGGQTLPLKPGDPIHQDDVLVTGADGRLGVTLRDETRVSLGPGTRVSLTQFAFAPGEGRLGLVLRVVSGLLSYVSGRIAALAPDAVRIETPASIIGVRGTHLLVSAGQPQAGAAPPAQPAGRQGAGRP
ncbi:MAG: FecR domain-containing protein [Vicinamibacterales bacterium]